MSIPQSGGGQIENRSELAEYLEKGCKPSEDWRIGTEHEKFGYCLEKHRPLPYEGHCSILTMLEGLRDRYQWHPVEEAGKLIGLEKDGANISLEPGGQLELSGAPLESIHGTCDEVNTHLREVKDIADEIGARLHRARRCTDLVARRNAHDAEGPLQAHDTLHEQGWHHGHNHDVSNMHGTGESGLRLGSRHGQEVPGLIGAAATRHRSLCEFTVLRRQGEWLEIVALKRLATPRRVQNRNAAICL